jgi:hypothetical protein
VSEYLLGLVPVGVGLVFGVLCLPRAVPPEDVPLPVPVGRVLAKIEAHDHALGTVPAPLPDDIRRLGTAIRAYHAAEAKQEIDPYVTAATMNDQRVALDDAAAPLLRGANDDDVLALRATQLEVFVAQVHEFLRTGKESDELQAVGGPFVRKMREAGWCQGHVCSFDEHALRVMYKLTWNGLLRLERPPFALALDEQRALYAFYLAHPHAGEAARDRIDHERGSARTPQACVGLAEAEALGAEAWRIERAKRIAELDPEYPRDYALAVMHFRHRDFSLAASELRDWLSAHPDGPWTLRARNYLRATLYEMGLE